MAAAATGKTVAEFLRDTRLYLNDNTFEDKMNAMADRRIAGEPIAYITGEWEFHGLPLNITHDVLIPRDDTEVLAQTAIEWLTPKGPNLRVLDLCCGSGCVGLSIAFTVRASRVIMADISEKALSVARSNVLKNHLTKSVTCMAADALAPAPMVMGKFDLIVCNPPYIPTDVIPTLDVSVRDYEPELCLDGGPDGLIFYRSIVKNWTEILKPGGTLMFECGINQAASVADIMKAGGFGDIKKYKDTLDIERVVTGKYYGGLENGR